jgi:hypothetical protein
MQKSYEQSNTKTIDAFYKISSTFKCELAKTDGNLINVTSQIAENTTLSFIVRPSGLLVYVCEFNELPEDPRYARFIYRGMRSHLDIASPEQQYQCPIILGEKSLIDHIELATTAIQFLASSRL